MSEALLNFVPQANELEGRVILVTGAGDGIGRAISKAYATFGASVVLLDKSIEKLESVYDEITDAGLPEPAIYPLDMAGAVASDYLEMAKIINEQMGRLDGLVLNAAWLPGFMPFEQYALESWQKVLTINLNANFLIAQSVLPTLKQSKHASIVHSAHGLTRAYAGAFGIAKAGMAAMVEILSDEYDNPQRFVKVNSIDTGPINTQMRITNYPGEESQGNAPAEAVVGPYLYFMSDASAAVTGEKVRFERVDVDFRWPGAAVNKH